MNFEKKCNRLKCMSNQDKAIKSEKKLFNILREGDKIRVFSGGNLINGTGIFIRIEDDFLIWVDSSMNINYTCLNGITIQRMY